MCPVCSTGTGGGSDCRMCTDEDDDRTCICYGAATGRKKRSAEGPECLALRPYEEMAFHYCPHGVEGFTWQEVEDCKSNFAVNASLPFMLPTKDAFDWIDGMGNKDSVLTMDEWALALDCDKKSTLSDE